MNAAAWLTVCTPVLALLVTLWTASKTHRKDSNRAIVEGAVELLKPYREEVVELRRQLAEANAELRVLRLRMRAMGIELDDKVTERSQEH